MILFEGKQSLEVWSYFFHPDDVCLSEVDVDEPGMALWHANAYPPEKRYFFLFPLLLLAIRKTLPAPYSFYSSFQTSLPFFSPLLIVEDLQMAVAIFSFRYNRAYFYHLGYLVKDPSDDGYKFTMNLLDTAGEGGKFGSPPFRKSVERNCACHKAI